MKYIFDGSYIIESEKEPNAQIDIGGVVVSLKREKPFTKRQIKHIRNYFGFEARNL